MGRGWTPSFSWEVTPGTRSSWAGLLVAALPTSVGTPVTCPPRRHGWPQLLPSPGCE